MSGLPGWTASEVVLNRGLQPPGQDRPGEKELTPAGSDQTRIALFQSLALKCVQQVEIDPGSRIGNCHPSAEVEIAVRRQLGVGGAPERIFGVPGSDRMPVGLEL